MRLAVLATAVLAGGAATALMESDALTALGLSNLVRDVAENGYPSPDTCTWENVVRRQEWQDVSLQSEIQV